MRKILFSIFILWAVFGSAQNPASFSKLTCPLYKILPVTSVPVPVTDMLYRVGNHLYWMGVRLDTVSSGISWADTILTIATQYDLTLKQNVADTNTKDATRWWVVQQGYDKYWDLTTKAITPKSSIDTVRMKFIKLLSIPETKTAKILYYDPITKMVTYGDSSKAVGGGGLQWSDTLVKLGTKYDIDTLSFLRSYMETDPVFSADSSKIVHWSDTLTDIATLYDIHGLGSRWDSTNKALTPKSSFDTVRMKIVKLLTPAETKTSKILYYDPATKLVTYGDSASYSSSSIHVDTLFIGNDTIWYFTYESDTLYINDTTYVIASDFWHKINDSTIQAYYQRNKNQPKQYFGINVRDAFIYDTLHLMKKFTAAGTADSALWRDYNTGIVYMKQVGGGGDITNTILGDSTWRIRKVGDSVSVYPYPTLRVANPGYAYFYDGTSDPLHTNRLNLDGLLWATYLYAGLSASYSVLTNEGVTAVKNGKVFSHKINNDTALIEHYSPGNSRDYPIRIGGMNYDYKQHLYIDPNNKTFLVKMDTMKLSSKILGTSDSLLILENNIIKYKIAGASGLQWSDTLTTPGLATQYDISGLASYWSRSNQTLSPITSTDTVYGKTISVGSNGLKFGANDNMKFISYSPGELYFMGDVARGIGPLVMRSDMSQASNNLSSYALGLKTNYSRASGLITWADTNQVDEKATYVELFAYGGTTYPPLWNNRVRLDSIGFYPTNDLHNLGTPTYPWDTAYFDKISLISPTEEKKAKILYYDAVTHMISYGDSSSAVGGGGLAWTDTISKLATKYDLDTAFQQCEPDTINEGWGLVFNIDPIVIGGCGGGGTVYSGGSRWDSTENALTPKSSFDTVRMKFVKLLSIPETKTAKILYYDPTTKLVSYGDSSKAVGGGGLAWSDTLTKLGTTYGERLEVEDNLLDGTVTGRSISFAPYMSKQSPPPGFAYFYSGIIDPPTETSFLLNLDGGFRATTVAAQTGFGYIQAPKVSGTADSALWVDYNTGLVSMKKLPSGGGLAWADTLTKLGTRYNSDTLSKSIYDSLGNIYTDGQVDGLLAGKQATLGYTPIDRADSNKTSTGNYLTMKRFIDSLSTHYSKTATDNRLSLRVLIADSNKTSTGNYVTMKRFIDSISTHYSKTATDNRLNLKVNLADSNKTSAGNYTTMKRFLDSISTHYSKTATDNRLSLKVAISDSNKTSAGNYVTMKRFLDSISTHYSKTAVDNRLSLKQATMSAGYRIGLNGATINNLNYHNIIDSVSSSIPYTSTFKKAVMIDTTTGRIYRRAVVMLGDSVSATPGSYMSKYDALYDTATSPRKMLNPTLANGATSSNSYIYFVANEAQVMGDVVFINSSGKAQIAKADAIANTNATLFMACKSNSANQTGVYMVQGTVRNDSWSAFTVGTNIYLTVTGTSTNTISQTAPSAANNVIQLIGVAIGSKTLFFNGNTVAIEHN